MPSIERTGTVYELEVELARECVGNAVHVVFWAQVSWHRPDAVTPKFRHGNIARFVMRAVPQKPPKIGSASMFCLVP